ncbi:hypothetical protein N866_06080 [Actinotalea ferrariae CF5-4]|uniref:Uncharacterized protein n=1 Tax=Actinotalea ferrariae CF5-4 TaxID=948458 RepID=A0A021W067_9CELL|nr:hypothetical protein [Actinotalea ferrariae]EYR64727.1 hypothetical protein N866_06080 [Actinotalea ferrariae CF5-4]
MSGPQWTWQFLAADDAEVDRPVSPAFTSRFDAEAWIGEHWRAVAGEGVATARLLHLGAAVAPALPLRKG